MKFMQNSLKIVKIAYFFKFKIRYRGWKWPMDGRLSIGSPGLPQILARIFYIAPSKKLTILETPPPPFFGKKWGGGGGIFILFLVD